MKLLNRTLTDISEMICGAYGLEGGFRREHFPYRSSYYLTQFFAHCEMDFVHDGSTRQSWVLDILTKLDAGPASRPELPADGMIRVVQELMDPSEFAPGDLDREAALEDLSSSLKRDGLAAHFDGAGRVFVRSIDTHVTSAALELDKRTWTAAELQRRAAVAAYLDAVSEDELIEDVLVPIFDQLGFTRISVSGHRDKALEFGKDLWMKYRLPTGHLIYFGVQAKRAKLDAAGKSRNENVAEVLAQVRMMLDHPVWDPETNKRNLLDHVFVACAGDITKQAREWLAQRLDRESRRHVLFMDRDDLLDLALRLSLPHLEESTKAETWVADDDIPF